MEVEQMQHCEIRNKHRVERAIIMAAGTGTRMRPVTLDTPKPLIRVNGVRMIDTVIRALQENIRTLESRPVEVAVQVDEGAVAKAREEEKAAAQKELERLEKKLQKAEKAREQAEATAKAAEDKLETAAADVAKERDGLKLELQEARRKLEMSDVTVAQFKIVFDTVQGNLNDMLALIAKASGENQTKLRAAAEKLLEAFGEKVKRNG